MYCSCEAWWGRCASVHACNVRPVNTISNVLYFIYYVSFPLFLKNYEGVILFLHLSSLIRVRLSGNLKYSLKNEVIQFTVATCCLFVNPRVRKTELDVHFRYLYEVANLCSSPMISDYNQPLSQWYNYACCSLSCDTNENIFTRWLILNVVIWSCKLCILNYDFFLVHFFFSKYFTYMICVLYRFMFSRFVWRKYLSGVMN